MSEERDLFVNPTMIQAMPVSDWGKDIAHSDTLYTIVKGAPLCQVLEGLPPARNTTTRSEVPQVFWSFPPGERKNFQYRFLGYASANWCPKLHKETMLDVIVSAGLVTFVAKEVPPPRMRCGDSVYLVPPSLRTRTNYPSFVRGNPFKESLEKAVRKVVSGSALPVTATKEVAEINKITPGTTDFDAAMVIARENVTRVIREFNDDPNLDLQLLFAEKLRAVLHSKATTDQQHGEVTRLISLLESDLHKFSKRMYMGKSTGKGTQVMF